ncbi:MAG: T9SS type A sorting domain-containing protein [Saprospiraceae bacterium]|nr:T9SS type A sorting domain-containing protein [Saprospiraceae bacterium]
MNRFILFLPLFFFNGLAAQMSWITACSDQTFCLTQNSCATGAVLLVEKAVSNCGSPLINYSYKIDLNNDNVVDIQSSLDTVAGPFAKGTHKITWKATDNCGNLLQCTYLFHVKDCQPPSLLCINGLTQALDFPDCQQSFIPSQFILQMSDNCTPNNQIQLGIRKAGEGTGFPTTTSLTFNECEKGFNSIEVWVKDGNGLANVCNNYVLIQEGVGNCVCNNNADVYFNGCASTFGHKKLTNFKLKTLFETLPGASLPLSTNYSQTIEDSCYTLHLDAIPFGNDYQATIRAERTLGALVGVTTYDLVLISKHILALEPFTSLYQTVAADVNRSNSVTTFDIVETRKLILGIYDTFPFVPAWRITRPVADPSQIANFSALKDTYKITLTNLVDDITLQNLHFVGIKYGDVNASASLTDEPGADNRYTAPPILLRSDDRWLEAGAAAIIRFNLAESATLEGWQLALEADPGKLQILSVEGLPDDHFVLRGPELRALWTNGVGEFFDEGDAIIELKIKALQATKISDGLFLNSAKLRPEAYTTKGNSAPDRRPLLLHFGENTDASATFFPPRPNPFAAETSFEILLENAAPAHLEVFDLNGRRVVTEIYALETGLQTLRLPASSLPGKGVFAYRLRVGDAVSRGRLVRI